MKKRLLGILLALCMVLSMLPLAVFADDACEHRFEFGYYTGSEEGHWKECDFCYYYDEDSFEAHYDEDGSGLCDVCYYGECIVHSFEGGYYCSAEEGHWNECDFCYYYDENSFEAHSDENGDAHCDICYYAADDDHSFEHGYYDTSEDGHRKACDICNYVDEYSFEVHFDEDGSGRCDVCYYGECIVHSFEEGYYQSTEEGHWKACDFCSYYDEDSFGAHSDEDADNYCDICGFYRCNNHSFEEGYYRSTEEGHWNECDFCYYYDEDSFEAHSDDNSDDRCDICGYANAIPGDLDGDDSVDNRDVEYLLWYTLFPEDYPVDEAAADFDSNGVVDNRDVEYLLWHTLFPEDYPII